MSNKSLYDLSHLKLIDLVDDKPSMNPNESITNILMQSIVNIDMTLFGCANFDYQFNPMETRLAIIEFRNELRQRSHQMFQNIIFSDHLLVVPINTSQFRSLVIRLSFQVADLHFLSRWALTNPQGDPQFNYGELQALVFSLEALVVNHFPSFQSHLQNTANLILQNINEFNALSLTNGSNENHN